MPVFPESRSLYVNAPLTNISVGYQQGPGARRFVADQVFPVVNVARQGDLYWKYKKGDWFRSIAGVRAPATESPGGGWETEQDSYFAHVYAVHKDIDDQTRANAATGPFDLDRDAALWVTQNLLIKRDRLFVDNFLRTGVWTGSTGIGGGANGADLAGGAAAGSNTFIQWDRAGSDPIADVATQVIGAARTTGFRPNVLVMGPDVWNALTQNTAILERIKYSERGIITEDLLRAVFNVDRVVVTWQIENTAPMGATDSFNFMNSKSALLVYAPANAGLMQPSGGYIFAWSGLLGAGAFGTRIRRFRMEPIQSDRIEGEMAFDMKVVSPDVGIFFSQAVQ
jgi:hypothetical protein